MKTNWPELLEVSERELRHQRFLGSTLYISSLRKLGLFVDSNDEEISNAERTVEGIKNAMEKEKSDG